MSTGYQIVEQDKLLKYGKQVVHTDVSVSFPFCRTGSDTIGSVVWRHTLSIRRLAISPQ